MSEPKLHDSRKPNKRFKWSFYLILFLQKNKKNFIKIIIILMILSLLIFPVFTGGLIGNWIKDFFGTIINIVKTI